MQLAPEELDSGWPPHLTSASALLALWRTRRTARPSHGDQLALHELYRCWEGHSHCPPRRCRHGGFTDTHCLCVCPLGFGGEDCGIRTAPDGDVGGGGCVRYLPGGPELRLSTSELPGLGTTTTGEPCVLRVKTSYQRLRILLTLHDVEGELSKTSPELGVALLSEAILCTIKMYVFQNGSPARIFCVLDYVGEVLSLNAASNVVDLLFSSDSSLADTRQMLQRTRLVVRSADTRFENLTGSASTTVTTSATTANTTAASTNAAVVEKGQARSAAGSAPFVNLIILPPVLFALMGFNILVVFCIRKYWEYRFGTAGIYRGTEGSHWTDQDEEEPEPEDWQIKVEYSDSSDGLSPMERGMTREVSYPQTELTDLELFRSRYGVPGHTPPDITGEKRLTKPAPVHVVPSEESQESDRNFISMLRVASSKTKKRVSFSDEIGKPLHVHSDASLRDDGKPPAPTREVEHSPTEPLAEVRISVQFTEHAQPPPTTEDSDSDSEEEDSEQSSCCDSSSSSSSLHDEDNLKKVEPGLLQGLARWFRKKPDNESSEI